MRSNKSIFITKKLRDLAGSEVLFYEKLNSIFNGTLDEAIVGQIPHFVSKDNESRPLILTKSIIQKIETDHGKIVPENLIINANDWDYVIRSVDGNEDKINLFKKIPDSSNILIIGANRINGYFMLTYYEVLTRNPEKLKDLLKRGDPVDATGGAAVPSSATFLL